MPVNPNLMAENLEASRGSLPVQGLTTHRGKNQEIGDQVDRDLEARLVLIAQNNEP